MKRLLVWRDAAAVSAGHCFRAGSDGQSASSRGEASSLSFRTAFKTTSEPAATSATAALPADGEVRRILAERIGKNSDRVGIVVGLISPSGRRSVSYGSRALGDSRPLDADTLFEIGSVTRSLRRSCPRSPSSATS
jgi:CubicO group peptidase (beta-lactamase class C family)